MRKRLRRLSTGELYELPLPKLRLEWQLAVREHTEAETTTEMLEARRYAQMVRQAYDDIRRLDESQRASFDRAI